MFDDIFTGIARDGAALVEVQLRLQKALHALAMIAPHDYAADAQRHAGLALARANFERTGLLWSVPRTGRADEARTGQAAALLIIRQPVVFTAPY